jgi:hypothetical protein
MLNPKDIGETALWQPSRERHLPALEMRLAATRTVMARARLDSLVPLSGSLPRSRSRTTAETLAIAMRSRRRDEIVQSQSRCLCLLCLLCLLCFFSFHLFLYRRDFHQVTNAFDLSTKRG